MYDAAHLYVAAHVGDPEPMRNASRDGFQFAGGSVIVRLSTDRRLGWPLKGINRQFQPQKPSRELLADSTNERVTSLILWYDAKSGRASLDLQHSFDFQPPAAAPAGWQGAFQKDADGLGYTLEYAIPWRLLHCESDPPRGRRRHGGVVDGALERCRRANLLWAVDRCDQPESTGLADRFAGEFLSERSALGTCRFSVRRVA